MKSTSLQAYDSVKPDIPGVKNQILQGLQKIKKGSFRDIATASYLRSDQVWKRLSELKQDGKITETGTKTCHISGRPVTIWKLIEN